MISGFLAWKNYDWGLFFFTKSRMIIQDNVFADNTNSINGMVYSPPALTHVTSDKFVHIKDTVFIGRTASWDCTIDAIAPATTVVNDFQRAFKTRSGIVYVIRMCRGVSEKKILQRGQRLLCPKYTCCRVALEHGHLGKF